MGASNGALHTTWRNSGAGVSGAAVDIGDPTSEGETADAEKAESAEPTSRIGAHDTHVPAQASGEKWGAQAAQRGREAPDVPSHGKSANARLWMRAD